MPSPSVLSKDSIQPHYIYYDPPVTREAVEAKSCSIRVPNLMLAWYQIASGCISSFPMLLQLNSWSSITAAWRIWRLLLCIKSPSVPPHISISPRLDAVCRNSSTVPFVICRQGGIASSFELVLDSFKGIGQQAVTFPVARHVGLLYGLNIQLTDSRKRSKLKNSIQTQVSLHLPNKYIETTTSICIPTWQTLSSVRNWKPQISTSNFLNQISV